MLVVCGVFAGEGEHIGVVGAQAVFGEEAGALGLGKLGHLRRNAGQPLAADSERDQIGFGKVAVVVRFFFGTHGDGFAGIGVV